MGPNNTIKSKKTNNTPLFSQWDLLLRLSKLTFFLSLFLSISFLIASFFSSSSYPSLTRWFSLRPTTFTCHVNLSDPGPRPTRLPDILFALSGSGKTWSERKTYSQLWWDPNTTRGHVWLDGSPGWNYTRPGNTPEFRVSTSLFSDQRTSDRIARILKESFVLGVPNVRWFVMGDDDTVFFKDNLVTVLSKYDHRKMYYIGGSSESVEQDVMHGYDTAFGGGGFAVSYTLACEMVNILEGCIDRYHSYYGSDEKIAACVSELGVPLTRESGFHQLDVRDDPYGLLAAHPVAPLVSLHHLDSVKPLFPGETQLDSLKKLMHAYNADPGNILQQSICYDHKRKWSVSISWGYTAQLYPSLVSSRVLTIPLQTFRTWRSSSEGPFVYNTRPLSPDPCDRPIIYYLDQVEDNGEGQTVTSYKLAAGNGQNCNQSAYKYAASIKKIIVSASKATSDKWLQAPRRDCCEVEDSRSLQRNMQVKIRKCREGETITM